MMSVIEQMIEVVFGLMFLSGRVILR